MRCGTLTAIFVILAGVPARGGQWDVRNRPGNDDVFIMIDTSSSMAPAAGGQLPAVRSFLQDLLARYIKDGDRVFVMTFDSDARIRGIVPIVERRRDVELLGDVIDGIDVRREIRYRGTYPDLAEARDGRLAGGGAAADYCDMWRLAARSIESYGEPIRRRSLLLFTGSSPAAPAYRPCADPAPPDVFSHWLRESRLRMGVVAIAATSVTANELARRLSNLTRRMSGSDSIPAGSLKCVAFQPGVQRVDDLRRDLLELLGATVDLTQPANLDLGVHYSVDLDVPVTLVNRSPMTKTIALRGATLRFPDGRRPLSIAISPAMITLKPDESGKFWLRRTNVVEAVGRAEGQIVFDFGPGDRFDPAVVPFSATKETWLHAYGAKAIQTATVFGAIAVAVCSWQVYQRRRSGNPEAPPFGGTSGIPGR